MEKTTYSQDELKQIEGIYNQLDETDPSWQHDKDLFRALLKINPTLIDQLLKLYETELRTSIQWEQFGRIFDAISPENYVDSDVCDFMGSVIYFLGELITQNRVSSSH